MIWKFEFSTYFYALKNCLMNQMPTFTFLSTSCVNPTQIGWMYAIGGLLENGDKADFHAIAAI
jgi:hypothetical protein